MRVAVSGYGVGAACDVGGAYEAPVGEELQLDARLDAHHGQKVVGGADVRRASQLALGVDVGVAEVVEVYVESGGLVGVAYDAGPVVAAAVYCAAVVEDYAFN